jgi:hypothetical protein
MVHSSRRAISLPTFLARAAARIATICERLGVCPFT